jgi:hypothetical protein
MASLATIIGLMPMAMKLGEGSESYAPLARPLIGGLLASVLLTVFLVSAGFFLAYRNRQNLWVRGSTPNQFQENRNYPLIGWRPVEKGLGKRPRIGPATPQFERRQKKWEKTGRARRFLIPYREKTSATWKTM